jgi:hypothetical protein
MASKTSRKEWVRGLPPAFGVGRYDRKRVHWGWERSVGYVFLIRDSVRNHPNPHPYQTGSKSMLPSARHAAGPEATRPYCGPPPPAPSPHGRKLAIKSKLLSGVWCTFHSAQLSGEPGR